MENNNFLEKWYKKKIEDGNEIPPDDIWKNVSKELDIRSVWSNISTELDHNETKKRRRVALAYVCSIAGLFFIGTLVFLVFDTSLENSDLAESKNNKTRTNTNPIEGSSGTIVKKFRERQAEKPNKIINRNALVSITVPLTSMTVPLTSMTAPVVSMTVPVISVNESVLDNPENSIDNITSKENNNANEVKKEMDYIQPIRFSSKPICFNDTNLISQPVTSYDTTENILLDKKKTNFGRFYAGGIFGVQNPWLLNNSTYNSFSTNSINESVPGIGNCYGVSLVYFFSHNWTITSNLFIQSKYGQTYNRYNNGTYENDKINLNYKQLNLYAVKRSDRPLKNKSLSLSYGPLLGINLKHLNFANQSINGKKNDIEERYSKYDFGLLLGYESNLRIKKRWMCSFSVSGDFGLNNIYVSNGTEPKTFNQTRNSSLRIAYGLMYLIR